jgi:predicted small metal-binding protein
VAVGYKFECTNVVPGCEGEVFGDTEEEVLAKAAEHASETHGIEELDDELAEQVKAAIVPA